MFLFLWTVTANAQQVEECGTPDIPLVQLQEFYDDIDSTSEGSVVSGTVAANGLWKISVWFYHLRRSDGTSSQQNTDIEQAIGEVNGYFGGLFEFVVCGTTNIDNDNYYSMDIGNSSTDLSDLWADIAALNEPLSEKCIRVFLVGQGNIHNNGIPFATGYGLDPLNYATPMVLIGSMNGRILAHELGHYFALPHTFQGGASIQYVHHPTDPENHPVTINGISHTCEQTGDGFCDTPADPRWCNLNNNCQITSCSPSLDPLGLSYAPDPTLIMSYFGNCRNRFSNEQRQGMRHLYLYQPDYAFLRPPPEACIAPKYGYIERNCDGTNPVAPYQPMVYTPVQVRGESTPFCNPQNNKTDDMGRYLTNPCPMTGTRRWVLPDRNYINDPYNGVSTFDMVRINQHILGIKVFDNPYQMIAADVNNSGSITTFDVVRIRMLILGHIDELLPGINWRYIPKFYAETQPFKDDFYANPFTAVLQDPFQGFTRRYISLSSGLNVPNLDSWMDFVSLFSNSGLADSELAWSFTGVKVGDVNCNAITEGVPFQGDDHEFQVDSSSLTSISFSGSKRVQVIVSAPKEVVAWQFGVRYASDSLTVSNLAAGTDAEAFDEDNFRIAPGGSLQESGTFRAIWVSEDGEPADIDNKVLFEFEATATQGLVQITQAFQLDKSALPCFFYDEDGELVPNVVLTLRITDVPQAFRVPVPPPHAARAAKPLRVKTFPMPFTSEIVFAFDLSKDEQVTLDVFDATGALVSSTARALPAGPHELHLGDLALRPAGFYWYVLRAGELVARGKLSKR